MRCGIGGEKRIFAPLGRNSWSGLRFSTLRDQRLSRSTRPSNFANSDSMKLVRIHRFGGPESLEIDDVPMPKPVDDEVVLRVHAAGVNSIDRSVARLPAPMGRDVSGAVEVCGVRAM